MDSNTNHEPKAVPQVSPLVSTFSSQAVTIASLALAVLCLAVFVLLRRRNSASKGNVLLLVGAPDAGKTAILSTLLYKQTLPTLASLQTNSSVIALTPTNKTLCLVDVPGHPRMRDQFQEYLPDAKAVVFVVDTSTVSRNGAAVAEHLHNILHALTSLPPSQQVPTLLILAHKADLLKSTSTTSENVAVNRVKSILERELEKRRVSQTGGVNIEGLGEEGERSDMGGLECSGPGGAEFRFADWEGGQVTFIGSSVRVGKGLEASNEKGEDVDGLSRLREWMQEIV